MMHIDWKKKQFNIQQQKHDIKQLNIAQKESKLEI